MRFTRAVFIRCISGIFLLAFLSVAVQMRGLYGSHGISPVNSLLAQAHEHPGVDVFLNFPSIFWFDSSDTFLVLVPMVGALFSLLALLGILSGPCTLVSWLLYLSIVTVGQEFMSFQWDILLLETGFLCIFLASWRPFDFLYSLFGTDARLIEKPASCDSEQSVDSMSNPVGQTELATTITNDSLCNSKLTQTSSKLPPWTIDRVEPPLALIWLCRWLLFRLMFQSGLCKIESGDQNWRNLTAMTYHYETQPLPTPLGWFAHQSPDPILLLSTVFVFVLEVILPLLVFAGRRARLAVAIGTVSLQVLILLTGNYCFFNLLTIALCLLLVDDAWLLQFRRLLRWRPIGMSRLPTLTNAARIATHPGNKSEDDVSVKKTDEPKLESDTKFVEAPLAEGISPSETLSRITAVPIDRPNPLRNLVVVPLTILIVFLTTSRTLFSASGVPPVLHSVTQICQPWHLVSSYGLFAVMTTSRPEIAVEGSMDGKNWKEYIFKYKPGPLDRAPPIVAPHQPRLDWQMWFAALGAVFENQWLVSFVEKLLDGSPDVLALLESDPFKGEKPKYIRASIYDYHMEDIPTLLSTGRWWKRKYTGVYLPAITKTSEQ